MGRSSRLRQLAASLAGILLLLQPKAATGGAGAQACDAVFEALERTLVVAYRLSRATPVNPLTGEAATSVQEFVPPDRYRIFDRDPEAFPGQVRETIIIGTRLYVRNAGSPWVQTDIPEGAMAALQVSARDRQNATCTLPSAEATGPEGSEVYEFRTRTDDGSSEGRIWIGVADGLPQRMEITSYLGDTVSSWTGVFEYGANIVPIERPLD